MQPLLSIKSTPIKINVNIVQGQLSRTDYQPAQVEVSSSPGGFDITAKPAKISVDNYKATKTLGYGHLHMKDFRQKITDKSIQIGYQGTAKIVNEGDQKAKGVSPAQLASQNMRAGASIETIMEFLPKDLPGVSFEKGELRIDYQMGDTNIDFKGLEMKPLKFTPGRVDINVAEMPRVEIEYIGEPIYVPASAKPAY